MAPIMGAMWWTPDLAGHTGDRSMAKKAISDEVRAEVEGIVARFNQTELGNEDVHYSVRFRGKYAYLDRYAYGHSGPICRLTYTSAMDSWEFAIFKYSREYYDPDDWFFPGAEHVDGTVEGAMRAGLEAYPP
jgi:hypothetical protein